MLLGIITRNVETAFSKRKGPRHNGQEAWRLLGNSNGGTVKNGACTAKASAEPEEAASPVVASCECLEGKLDKTKGIPSSRASHEAAERSRATGTHDGTLSAADKLQGNRSQPDAHCGVASATAEGNEHDISSPQGSALPCSRTYSAVLQGAEDLSHSNASAAAEAASAVPAFTLLRPIPAGDAALVAWRSARRVPLEGTLVQEIGCARCGAALSSDVSAMLALSLPLLRQEVSRAGSPTSKYNEGTGISIALVPPRDASASSASLRRYQSVSKGQDGFDVKFYLLQASI